MIQIVMGTRPEIIKGYSVIKEIQRRGADLHLTFTGQHYDLEMSKTFFQELDIPDPDENLGVKEKTHGRQTAKMLLGLENSLEKVRPCVVVVIGDTNSALAGCLAAVKMHIPVAHIEAGCRSFDMRMPEEVNRVLIDAVASIHFAPSETAAENLVREGKGRETIRLYGNTIVKPLRLVAGAVSRLPTKEGILVTIHRAENTDDEERLSEIVDALVELGTREAVVFPVHPRTRAKISAIGRTGLLMRNVRVTKPLGYRRFIETLANSRIVITDSGGVQEEAAIVGTPCITVRETTEWPETVAAGANTLVPAKRSEILKAVERTQMIMPSDIFKEGDERKMVDVLCSFAAGADFK